MVKGMENKWPSTSRMTIVTLEVLIELGEVGHAPEIDQAVQIKLNLSDDLTKLMRSETRSELRYRLAWVRTKAKSSGLIDRQASNSWKITEKGKEFLKSSKS
jgi:hypothetical protein